MRKMDKWKKMMILAAVHKSMYYDIFLKLHEARIIFAKWGFRLRCVARDWSLAAGAPSEVAVEHAHRAYDVFVA